MSEIVDWRSRIEPFGPFSNGNTGFVPATPQELEELRAACGAAAFPPLFVEIATSLGNVAFAKEVCVTSLGGEELGVEAFFGGAPSVIDLLRAHAMFPELSGLPSYWVPFARDGFSQDYVFDSRDLLGPVFIEYDGFQQVAHSFEEFVMGLHVGDE